MTKKALELHNALQALFGELNHQFFGGVLPALDLRFTGRLKSTGGQYFRKPVRRIQISTRYLLMENAWSEIRDTLGHEMIHYWLDFQEKPCGHTPEFRRKLRECGFQRYSRLAPVHARYLYACPGCSAQYYRRKKGIWSCGPCSGKRFNLAYKLELIAKIENGRLQSLQELAAG